MPLQPLTADAFVTAYRARGREDAPAWLIAARDAAMAQLAETGLPHRKVEAWKYTDLRRFVRADWRDAPAPTSATTAATTAADRAVIREDPIAGALDAVDADCAVFVDGGFRPDLSRLDALPTGAEAIALSTLGNTEAPDWLKAMIAAPAGGAAGGTDAAGAARPFALLAAGMARDGLALRLAPGARLLRPLRLVTLRSGAAAGAAQHLRLLIELGDDAAATLIEEAAGPADAAAFVNRAADIRLGRNAAFDHYMLRADGAKATAVATTRVTLARMSRLRAATLSLGAALQRLETAIDIAGPGADAQLDHAVLAGGSAHVDIAAQVDHAQPDASSRLTAHVALQDRARCAFQPKALVRPGAIGTDARQMSRGLLMSEGAEMDAKPELEIHADDVVCAHGATIGALDADALFYLRARGVDAATARAILTRAFMTNALSTIGDAAARDAFAGVLDRALGDANPAVASGIAAGDLHDFVI